MFHFIKSHLAIVAVAAILLGCDVSSGLDEGGIGGSGLIIGRVTNADKLHIEGRSVSLANAKIVRNSQVVGSEDVQFNVGEYVSVSRLFPVEAGNSQVVEYSAPVIGPVTRSSNSPGGLAVAGQSVSATDLVIYSGVADESQLMPGDIVEVSGFRGTEDALHATRIVKHTGDDATSAIRLVGLIRMLGRDSFIIGGATLDASKLTNGIGLSLEELKEGLEVSVIAETSSDELTYSAISVFSTSVVTLGDEGSAVSISGIPDEYTDPSEPFKINGFEVKLIDETILDNGVSQVTLASANANAVDPIAGSSDIIVTGLVNSSGQIVVFTLFYLPAFDLIELSGVVDVIDQNGTSLVVDGVDVMVSPVTLFSNSVTGNATEPGNQLSEADQSNNTSRLILSDLSVGDNVRVVGIQNSDSSVFARQLIRFR